MLRARMQLGRRVCPSASRRRGRSAAWGGRGGPSGPGIASVSRPAAIARSGPCRDACPRSPGSCRLAGRASLCI